MNVKTATTGDIIIELILGEIRATKEVNTTRGLTKKTATELDKMYQELLKRGVLTEEQIEKVNR